MIIDEKVETIVANQMKKYYMNYYYTKDVVVSGT